VKSLSSSKSLCWTMAVHVSGLSSPCRDLDSVHRGGHARPGDQSGRVILRAHHRLQC
jgi:hypothetical protein